MARTPKDEQFLVIAGCSVRLSHDWLVWRSGFGPIIRRFSRQETAAFLSLTSWLQRHNWAGKHVELPGSTVSLADSPRRKDGRHNYVLRFGGPGDWSEIVVSAEQVDGLTGWYCHNLGAEEHASRTLSYHWGPLTGWQIDSHYWPDAQKA